MEHGQDLRQYGLTSHEGSRGSTLYDRIKKYNLLIDDGCEERGQTNTIRIQNNKIEYKI